MCLGLPAAAHAAPPPQQTINKLRFGYTDAQLNHLYGTLSAGAMPEGTSRGFVRFDLGTGLDLLRNRQGNEMFNDPIRAYFWDGQRWFVNGEGEQELENVVLNGSSRQFPAYVWYGPSLLDGRTAMIADYPGDENPPPVNNIVLDCRDVQAGVLMCYAWYFWEKPFVGPKTLLFYVFQEFARPSCPSGRRRAPREASGRTSKSGSRRKPRSCARA
jgi:hypothetical protein